MAFSRRFQRVSFVALLVCLASSCVHGKSLFLDGDAFALARPPTLLDEDLMLGDQAQSTQLAPWYQPRKCGLRQPEENDIAITSTLNDGETVETHALADYGGAEEVGDRTLHFGANIKQFDPDMDGDVEVNCTTSVYGVSSEAEWDDELMDMLEMMTVSKWDEEEQSYTPLHSIDVNTTDLRMAYQDYDVTIINERWMSSINIKWLKSSSDVVGEYLCEISLRNEADGESHPHRLTASIDPDPETYVAVTPTIPGPTECEIAKQRRDQLEKTVKSLEKLTQLHRDDYDKKITLTRIDPKKLGNRAFFILHKKTDSHKYAVTACKDYSGGLGAKLADATCDEINQTQLTSVDGLWIDWKWEEDKWIHSSKKAVEMSSCVNEATTGTDDSACAIYKTMPDKAPCVSITNTTIYPLCVLDMDF